MVRLRRASVSLALLAPLWGCDAPEDEVAPIEAPPVEEPDQAASDDLPPEREADRYRVAEVPSGTIEGVVRWRGRRPRNPRLEVHAQHRVCGREQEVPAVRIGRGGGIEGAVLEVAGVEAGPRQAPTSVAELDQVGCRYVPHTLAVMRGQRVTFRNSDEVLHNVHAIWEDGEEWFNIGQPRAGMSTTQVPERSGVARVVCDAGHAWMLAWVHVMEHPYFAVTDEEGAFRIEEVPAGEQELRLWHQGWEVVEERSGRPHFAEPVEVTRRLEVPADGVVRVELELPQVEPDSPSASAAAEAR